MARPIRFMILLLVALLLSGLFPSPARAADPNAGESYDRNVDLRVRVGWLEVVRPGRWTPVFITASDSGASDAKPRSIRIEVEATQNGPAVMQVNQYAMLSAREVTYSLIVPLRHEYGEEITITVRDANSGKALAKWPREEDPDQRNWSSRSDSNKRIVGVVGSPAADLDRINTETGNDMRLVRVPYADLPDQAIGLDSLDLLVLHRANINAISKDRQQAIVDWVRAGGCLLMWPGDEGVPAGPLADALPARVGQPKDYPITSGQLRNGRKVISGFELTPVGRDSKPIALLKDQKDDPEVVAYTRSLGFGRITLAPFDASAVQFNWVRSGTSDFYNRLVDRLGVNDQLPPTSGGYSYGSDPIVHRQDYAAGVLEDRLADIPGAGRFGFSYIAWVVLGMMVLVGPVDWFVLKKLGRQPWTWVTTTGWIGLITVGALYIGRVFKSGDLHFRTIEMVDQADDRVVSRVTLAGIYAPRTTVYHVDAAPTQKDANGNPVPTKQPPGGWWQPAPINGWYGRGLRSDAPFHQSVDGNAPEGMTINVWNLRFLRGEMPAGGEPMVRGDLSIKGAKGTGASSADTSGLVITGTIKNVSEHTLTNVRIQIGQTFIGSAAVKPQTTTEDTSSDQYSPRGNNNGSSWQGAERQWRIFARAPVIVAKLGPGESATINTPLTGLRIDNSANDSSRSYSYSYYNDTQPPTDEYSWVIARDLAARRSWRANIEAAGTDTAVVYATIADPKPPVAIRETGAKERHEAFLRALVPVKPDEKNSGPK